MDRQGQEVKAVKEAVWIVAGKNGESPRSVERLKRSKWEHVFPVVLLSFAGSRHQSQSRVLQFQVFTEALALVLLHSTAH